MLGLTDGVDRKILASSDSMLQREIIGQKWDPSGDKLSAGPELALALRKLLTESSLEQKIEIEIQEKAQKWVVNG